MINIVFQNENFVVLNKPASVLSVPSRDREDPRPCLGLLLQKHLNQPVLPVHRLDFEVSGLIIFAVKPHAHRISQDWFNKKIITKKYTATTRFQDYSHWPSDIKTVHDVIEAAPQQNFFWKTQIQRGKRRSFESMHGEWAETKAIIKSVLKDGLHWGLFPLTGKPHQLRLELSRRGFPIDGDKLYGSKVILENKSGIALEAVSLDLTQIADRMGLPAQINLYPTA